MFHQSVKFLARQSTKVVRSTISPKERLINGASPIWATQIRLAHANRKKSKEQKAEVVDGHGGYTEPEYQIDFQPTLNPDKIHIPFIPDRIRQDIYAKYVVDSKKWSIHQLAQMHSAHVDRIQAIILLMHRRYTMMKQKGILVEIIGNAHSTKHSVKVAVPKQWQAFYDAHTQNPEKSLAELLNEYNENAKATGQPDAGINEEGLKKILETVEEHTTRMQNVLDHEESMQETVNEYGWIGADTRFRETLGSDRSKNPKDDKYFPRLLGDDDYESGKKDLLKRIKEETKAKVNASIEYYDFNYSPLPIDKNAVGDGDKASRWKYALRDTSAKKSNGEDEKPVPTIIRSRLGKLRTATPIEEAQRSWNRRVSYLDYAFYKAFDDLRDTYLKRYENFDQDDHLTTEITKEKNERREAAAPKK